VLQTAVGIKISQCASFSILLIFNFLWMILWVVVLELMCWFGVLGRYVVVGSGRHGWGVLSATLFFMV
jgi:hypothetical protein